MATYEAMRKSSTGRADTWQHEYRGEILVVARCEAGEESATLDYAVVGRQEEAVAWLVERGCERSRAVAIVRDSHADLYASCEVAQ